MSLLDSASATLPSSLLPLLLLPLSGAEKRFIAYVDRFHSGAGTARAVVNSVCLDPVRNPGVIAVLDFLAGNYLLVSNKEAAADLGFSCLRAAESICHLVRTSVPDLIIEYVNDHLAPPSCARSGVDRKGKLSIARARSGGVSDLRCKRRPG
ncbi:hypothetical protein DFJ73DRAFT_778743 [Zopfochytrium polystomum]|nr:hypothetical protein DFJ73DRAFT_778743 [Zopfochytrium polystomum]